MDRAAFPARPAPTGLLPIAVLVGLLLGLPARAVDGALPDAAPVPDCSPVTIADVEAMIDRARRALMAEDLDTVDAVQDELVQAAPCLDRVVPAELWARHLVSLAIAAYVRNEDWQTPLASALAASPTVNRVVRGDTIFARWIPPPTPPTTARPIDYDVHVYVDGRRVTVAEPLRGPHLVQVEEDGRLRSRLVVADGSGGVWEEMLPPPPVARAPRPDATTEQPPSPAATRTSPRATPWFIAGGSAAALGGGVGVATWAMRGQGDRDPDRQGTLVAGNVVGWSVAAVGGALLGVGVVQVLDGGSRLRVGAGTIGVEARF